MIVHYPTFFFFFEMALSKVKFDIIRKIDKICKNGMQNIENKNN